MLPNLRRHALTANRHGSKPTLRSIGFAIGCCAVVALSGTALWSQAQAEGTVYITGNGVFRPIVQAGPAAPLRFSVPSQVLSSDTLVDRTRALSAAPAASGANAPTLGDVVRDARWRQGVTSTVSSSMATKEEIQSGVAGRMQKPSYGVAPRAARDGRTPSLGSAF